jgi:hypothetical protein
MAIRQVRVYFCTGDKKRDAELSFEYWFPFNAYGDMLMRGRFKDFGGPEVKGCDVVNLLLHERPYFNSIMKMDDMDNHKWLKMLNVITCSVIFDYDKFIGTWDQKFSMLINEFVRYSSLSDIAPLMKIGMLMDEKHSLHDTKDFEICKNASVSWPSSNQSLHGSGPQ